MSLQLALEWIFSFQYPNKLLLRSKWVKIPEKVHSRSICIKIVAAYANTSAALFLFVLWTIAYLFCWRKRYGRCPLPPSVCSTCQEGVLLRWSHTERSAEGIVATEQSAVEPWHLECWTGKTVGWKSKLIWSLKKTGDFVCHLEMRTTLFALPT